MTFYLDISFNEEIASMLSADGKQLQLPLKTIWVPEATNNSNYGCTAATYTYGFPVAKSSVKPMDHIILSQLISL